PVPGTTGPAGRWEGTGRQRPDRAGADRAGQSGPDGKGPGDALVARPLVGPPRGSVAAEAPLHDPDDPAALLDRPAPATPAVGPGGGAPAQVGTPLGEVPLLLGGRRTTARRATAVCGGGVAARRSSAGRRATGGRPVGRRTVGGAATGTGAAGAGGTTADGASPSASRRSASA